jgi:hypothetical protein
MVCICVCVVVCLGRGLATSWSPVQGVLPPVYRLGNWNKAANAHRGCRAIEKKLLGVVWGWVYLVRRPLFDLLYEVRMTDHEPKAVGGMRISRKNRSTWRKHVPVPFCPLDLPHDIIWIRTRAAEVGSRGLIFFYLHSGGWSPNWVHSARRPLTGLLYLPVVIVRMENLVEWMAGETEVLGENVPRRHFVHHKSNLTRPGIEPGSSRWEVRYGAASRWLTDWAISWYTKKSFKYDFLKFNVNGTCSWSSPLQEFIISNT